MRTVEMDRDFAYIPHPSTTMMYYAGRRYDRVPEAAVAKIVEAGAGRVVGTQAPADEAQGQTEGASARGRRTSS